MQLPPIPTGNQRLKKTKFIRKEKESRRSNSQYVFTVHWYTAQLELEEKSVTHLCKRDLTSDNKQVVSRRLREEMHRSKQIVI